MDLDHKDKTYYPTQGLEQVEESILKALAFQSEGPPRQNRANETRKKIVDCATEAYATLGYGSVSSYEIADRAGVTQGLITYHFKSKDGLWKAVMDELFGQLRNTLTQRIIELREVEMAQRYKLIIRHFIRWSAMNPFLPRLIVDEGHDENERIKWLCERHIVPIHSAFDYLLRNGQDAGIIKKIDLTSLYYIMVNSVMIFATKEEAMMVAKKDVSTPEFVESHASALIDLIFIDS